MARKTTGPRYYASKGGYYVTINGERVCLAKGPKADPEVQADAERKYLELKIAALTQVEGDRSECIGILDAYLCAVRRKRKPNTFAIRKRFLQAFCSEFGAVRVRDLDPRKVAGWLDDMEERPRQHEQRGQVKWGPSTRGMAITSLKAGFNWAVKERLISKNPLAEMEKPSPISRGGEQLLTEEGHQKLLSAAAPFFRDFLIALNETGARPGEVANVTAADFHAGPGAWVLKDHKTAWAGKDRVIYLTPTLVEIVKRLSARSPEGPIFRNRYGRPWKLGTIAAYFSRLRKRLNLGRVSAYSYRHKFATEFLLSGRPIAQIAELQGSSIQVIAKHYSHLREHGPALRQALLDFRAGAGVANQGQPPRLAGP